jgi:hypothetical protein
MESPDQGHFEGGASSETQHESPGMAAQQSGGQLGGAPKARMAATQSQVT